MEEGEREKAREKKERKKRIEECSVQQKNLERTKAYQARREKIRAPNLASRRPLRR